MGRLIAQLIGRTLGKRSGAWLISTGLMFGFRLLRKAFRRKQLVGLSKSKPGDKYVVEHLDITHAQHKKQRKRDRKAAKRS